MGEEKLQHSTTFRGTLAIDLGSTTTVVAFQPHRSNQAELLELAPISIRPGEIPSLVWQQPEKPLIGREVIDCGLDQRDDPRLHRDFKRTIGNPDALNHAEAAWAGEQVLQQVWARLPKHLLVDRLVLSAPVDSYRAYRSWLLQVCDTLPVDEVALVDEPTAAGLGAGLPPGSRLLVVDLGGSTLDLALVALEGGEGKAAPIAQLLRLGGRRLGEGSGQKLRTARVLGKAGLRLGGRDIDRWIVNACVPDHVVNSALLNAAERLKCRLSDCSHPERESLEETVETEPACTLRLSRRQLNALLITHGLDKALDQLLESTLTGGRQHSCNLEDLQGVVAVGGGAQLPWLRDWLQEHTAPAPLLTPPPVEAIAIGALKLTPGVTIRDVLQRGVSLRIWDQRSRRHQWHPLFMAGQPWPSQEPFELVLAASWADQTSIELVLGEPLQQQAHDVVFVNGLPTLQQRDSNTLQVDPWPGQPLRLPLTPPGQPGEDCLRLLCSIDDRAQLQLDIHDLRSGLTLSMPSPGTVR